MANKCKILTVSSSGFEKREGISTVILDYYTLFDRNKFQLELVVAGEYDENLLSKFKKIGVVLRYLPSRKKKIKEYILALARLMWAEKYDAIYIHGSSAILAIELVVARMCGCKIRAVHSHSTSCDHKKADKLLRPIFYRNYTVALACGEATGKWLFGDRSFTLIKNGRNTETYSFRKEKREKMRQDLGLTDQVLAIGHVGNFTVNKNQAFLLEVLEQCLKKNINAKLFLMGEGETRENIMKKAERKSLSKYVSFTGSIANVPDMLQAMDLMLLPSLFEGLPLVAVEWQMMGLPCLLSDTITRECVFTDLVRFLPIDDPELWANMILEYQGKLEDRPKKAKAAIIAAQKNGYDINSNVQVLQDVFINR